MEKVFYVQGGIGKVKYLVSYHDGEKTHKDGSAFFDVALFRNKVKLDVFVKDLKEKGYKEK